MIRIICILSTIVLLIGCEGYKWPCPKWDQISVSIQIMVVDSAGNNLLGDTIPNGIDPDRIRLYDVINGKKQLCYYPNLDVPFCVSFVNESGRESIVFTPNISNPGEEYITTYIDWGNGDLDTVVSYVWRNGECDNPIICKKVWFNGVLMYPDSAIKELGRAFRIVK